MLVRADDPNSSKMSYLAMGASSMQTLYQTLVCKFSLRVTAPLASHMLRFRMYLPGKSSCKAQPLLLHPPQAHPSYRFTILPDFFQKLQLQSAPLANAT